MRVIGRITRDMAKGKRRTQIEKYMREIGKMTIGMERGEQHLLYV